MTEKEQQPVTPDNAPSGLSDDVSEAMTSQKAEPVASPDITGDVSEAIDESPGAAEVAATTGEDSAPKEVEAAPAPTPEASAKAPEEVDGWVQADAADEADEAQESGAKSDKKASKKDSDRGANDADVNPYHELRQLMELAVKYPEIGPPLAELAFKVGHADIGERIVRMGLDDDSTTGVEFYAVAVDVARREGRYEEVFSQVEDALKTFSETDDDAINEDEANRLLHLVRSGFAVLLFDLEDVNAKPTWIETLATQLPRLESRYSKDAFYYSLLAQALWFTDKEKSEQTWDRAVEISESDFAWNARGTWYKDAVSDFELAQQAYRKGLETHKESALLLHNLAQLLTDEAEQRKGEDADAARGWLKEADELVRRALRERTRRGLRRYIHGTRDRIRKLQSALPTEERDPPNPNDTVKGRVVALAPYGAFVTLPGGYKGLLHNSEIAHERVNKPDNYFAVGDTIQVKVLTVEKQDDGTYRIGFSRKALLEKPPQQEQKSGDEGGGEKRPNERRNDNRKGKKGGRNRNSGKNNNKRSGHRESPKAESGIGSLGEMLLAKLEEAKGQSED